jgi:hypothetical protein
MYTRAQIRKQLWSSVGCQLARKGKEYRRRCAARIRAQPGDELFQPGRFPTQQRDEKVTELFPELPKEDLEEVRTELDRYLEKDAR